MVSNGLVLARDNIPNWVLYIQNRLRNHKNFVAFISGQTGSGKSYASLSIAEMADKNFCIDQVVFSAKELMEVINSGKLRKGSVIVFEEVGVEISNRNWQSVINKMLNYLFQTFRHRNFVLLMNAPYMDFVDAATRKLFHAEFQTQGIDFERCTTKLKPQLIQYNGRFQKFYYKYLRVITYGGVVPLKRWSVPKPSQVLIDLYEKKKLAYTSALNARINTELDNMGKKDAPKNSWHCKKCGRIWNSRVERPGKCSDCKSKDIERVENKPSEPTSNGFEGKTAQFSKSGDTLNSDCLEVEKCLQ